MAQGPEGYQDCGYTDGFQSFSKEETLPNGNTLTTWLYPELGINSIEEMSITGATRSTQLLFRDRTPVKKAYHLQDHLDEDTRIAFSLTANLADKASGYTETSIDPFEFLVQEKAGAIRTTTKFYYSPEGSLTDISILVLPRDKADIDDKRGPEDRLKDVIFSGADMEDEVLATGKLYELVDIYKNRGPVKAFAGFVEDRALTVNPSEQAVAKVTHQVAEYLGAKLKEKLSPAEFAEFSYFFIDEVIRGISYDDPEELWDEERINSQISSSIHVSLEGYYANMQTEAAFAINIRLGGEVPVYMIDTESPFKELRESQGDEDTNDYAKLPDESIVFEDIEFSVGRQNGQVLVVIRGTKTDDEQGMAIVLPDNMVDTTELHGRIAKMGGDWEGLFDLVEVYSV